MSEKDQFQTHSFGIPSPAPVAPVAPPPPDPVPPDLFEDPFDLSPGAKIVALRSLRKRLSRVVAPAIALLLIVAIGYVWFSPSATPPSPSLSNISQQSFGNAPASGASGSDGSGGDLHVYVVGAVKHPGV